MARKNTVTDDFSNLRERAEERVGLRQEVGLLSTAEIVKIVHDLRVHHVELEMQNEELRRSRMEIADLHRRYSDLYDFAPIAYFTLDEKGAVIEVNATGALLFDTAKAALTGQRLDHFIAQGLKKDFRGHLKKALETAGRQTCNTRFTRKNGSAFDGLVETIAVVDDEGVFSEYRTSVTDITRMTDMQEALRASEERYRRIVEDSTEFIGRADAEGTITFVNRALCLYFGMEGREFLGKNVADFVPAGERAALSGLLSSFDAARETREIEQQVLMPNGEIRWHLWTIRAICGKGGQVIELQGAGRDITARKQMEVTLEERTRRLEEINKELESFSYSVSHDLRAPLRAIDGYARLILKKKGKDFDADTLDKFNVIRSSTHLMGQLIDDLLTFSRLGRKQVSKVPLDMDVLMRDAWREAQIGEPRSDLRFTVKSLPAGYGDMTLVKQVCINLLSNAAKFTKYKSPAQIEAGGYVEGNECVYYIKDNGAGFDMAYYDKLFGVFQRLHSMEQFEGTGIGLATVQRIIRRHGGRVWAEGKVDEGACFYFTLNMKE